MAMKNLIPWSRSKDVPSSRFEESSPFFALHRQMNRLFDDFFRDFDLPPSGRTGWRAGVPHVEISEDDKDVKLTAELPGLDDKDVEVTLRDGILTLSGEKKSETNGSEDGGHYSERWFGRFERSFDLGSEVDPDKVSAVFKKGVLTVTVGKRAEAQSRVKRIAVSRE